MSQFSHVLADKFSTAKQTELPKNTKGDHRGNTYSRKRAQIGGRGISINERAFYSLERAMNVRFDEACGTCIQTVQGLAWSVSPS